MKIKHAVSLDQQQYQSKPGKEACGIITNNLGNVESNINLSIKELIRYLILPNGQSWCPAIFTDNKRSKKTWMSQGFIAVDFDVEDPNHPDPKKAKKYKDEIAEKKRFFGDKYEPVHNLEMILKRCEKYGVLPCAGHTSFSSDETNNRYRLIFQLHEACTNPKIMLWFLYTLYILFPESDMACSKDYAHFFFGGIDEIYEGYGNILNPENLYMGVSNFIDETYPDNAESIKQAINSVTMVGNVKIIGIRDYLSYRDPKITANCIEYLNDDRKMQYMEFEFGKRVTEEEKKAFDLGNETIDKKGFDHWSNQWIPKALEHINSGDRKVWIDIGFCLKNEFGDDAFGLWKEWSKKASNADDDEELQKRWDSLDPTGAITLGSLYKIAKNGGWDPIPETVKKLNEKYFHYINDSGNEVIVEKCEGQYTNSFNKVIKDEYLKEIKRHPFINFKEGVRPLTMEKNGAKIEVNRAKWWLSHPKRKRVKKIVFKPDGKIEPGEYNLWTNFSSMKENVPKGQANKEKFRIYLDHIKEIIADGDQTVYKYIIGWMAFAVQFPHKLPEVAMIMVGLQGTGKSLFVDLFGQIFGKHYICLQSENELTGRFNSHLANKVLVFADEAVWKGDHKAINKLKNSVTAGKINKESKGQDIVVIENFIHLMMASNNRTVLKIDPDDRRFFIVEVNNRWAKTLDEPKEIKDARKKHFDDMIEEFNQKGGMEHFFAWLRDIPLGNFDIKDYPDTDIKNEHKLEAIGNDFRGWMYSKLQYGVLYEGQETFKYVGRDDLYDDYCEYMNKIPDRYAVAEERQKFGRSLQKYLPDCVEPTTKANYPVKVNGEVTHKTVSAYTFVNLSLCRKIFEKTVGFKIKWERPDELENDNPLRFDPKKTLSGISGKEKKDDGWNALRKVFEEDEVSF